jgi:tRNA(fMet)-specific endonuclease VapC
VKFLLDTNVCIALLRDDSEAVARRFERAIHQHGPVCISSLVLCELWYGVFRSSRPDENAETLQKFLRGPIEVLTFDDEDARTAGEIRAELARTGKTIGAYDTLIAGQGLSKGLTVVTSNLGEFERVKNLRCQDWAKES